MSLAIEMADALDEGHPHYDDAIAAELRRLHARSEEQERLLRDALEEIKSYRRELNAVTASRIEPSETEDAIRKHLGEQT